jgi:hypothetical protein
MNIRKFSLAVGTLFVLSGASTLAVSDSYRLSFKLSQGGHTLASPVLVVNPGVPAAIEVSGNPGYRIDVTVESAGEGMVKVATHLSTAQGSVSPTLLVKFGQSASVQVGEIGMQLTAAPFGS